MVRAPRVFLAITAASMAFGVACSDATGVTGDPQAQNQQPVSAVPSAGGANPLAGMSLFVDPVSAARQQAAAWRTTRAADAQQMDKIAAQPHAVWFGSWNTDVRADVDKVMSGAQASGTVPVIVAYNIPLRDCGGYSAGGAASASAYRSWISAFAAGIGARRAIVILEPDALPGMDCLSSSDQGTRLSLLADAVNQLRTLSATVYLDAGHSNWQSAPTMADRLSRAGVARADGFALNVSNFYTTSTQVVYGDAISALIGGKHYVIDTSRNGLGSAGADAWCNPDGRALGERPTTLTASPLVDAFLWVKTPGESDGSCNGAPAAGAWMPEYALGLAQRASY